MPRISPSWFEFNGKKTGDYKVILRSQHTFSTGAARGTQETVSGKSGYLWISDNTREAFDIKQTLLVPSSQLSAVTAWLAGSGDLRYSNREGVAYEARVIKKTDYKRVSPGKDPLYEITVTFTCQPYAHIYPAAEDISVTESGTLITNPGNAPSLPRLKITGSGSFSIMFGMQRMVFTGVSDGGIIVDSELQDALTYDNALLANDKVSGDFFELPPGNSTIQWLLGGDSAGAIDEIVITPRWRCI